MSFWSPIKLKNSLVSDIKTLYNDDNIKFEILYEAILPLAKFLFVYKT